MDGDESSRGLSKLTSRDQWEEECRAQRVSKETGENAVPASGGPTQKAAPWNMASQPKAFVRLSIPNSSTKTIGRRDVHVAGNEDTSQTVINCQSISHLIRTKEYMQHTVCLC